MAPSIPVFISFGFVCVTDSHLPQIHPQVSPIGKLANCADCANCAAIILATVPSIVKNPMSALCRSYESIVRILAVSPFWAGPVSTSAGVTINCRRVMMIAVLSTIGWCDVLQFFTPVTTSKQQTVNSGKVGTNEINDDHCVAAIIR